MPNSKKHSDVSDRSEKTIKALIADLDSKDGMVREKARKTFVKMGSAAIDFLAELVESPSNTLRWESTKALGQIADPAAAPLLVVALQDSDYEVRWIATEGLIKMGTKSLKPLLEALIERPGSLNLRNGAHHILHDLKEMDAIEMTDKIDLMMMALESSTAEDEVPIVAYRLLQELE